MDSNGYLKKIAIVGASGNVGATTLHHLLEINHQVQITIVTRHESTATFPSSPQISVAKGSYDDPDFLRSAFEGHDLAMFTLSFVAQDVQEKLIDAAAKAGVKWIIPNEYGSDGERSEIFEAVPMLHPKLAARRQIEALAKTFTGLKWIGVTTGPWTEASLNPWTELTQDTGPFGIDIPNRRATLWSGTGSFNSSSDQQIGRGIARLISLPITTSNPQTPASLEFYGNHWVYISSFLVTQEAVLAAVKRATGTTDEDWDIKHQANEERREIARKKVESGDFMAFAALAYSYYMATDFGGNYEVKAKRDRALLGLEEEDLDEVVKRVVAKVGSV